MQNNQVLRAPYLIQRAKIKTPLAPEGTLLTEAIRLDYMGSAEFEFGALPDSLEALHKNRVRLRLIKVPSITDGERQLRVLSALSDADFAVYVGYLKKMRKPNNGIYTKECTQFEERAPGTKFGGENDFWWDIKTHVMFSFNKLFMNRLGAHLAVSWNYMHSDEGTP